MDVKEEEILGADVGEHWYYRAKGAALLEMLPVQQGEKLVDVGAGSGFFSRLLLQKGRVEQSTCVDPAYAEDSEEVVAGRPLHFRRTLTGESSSLVLMMDVIEHVDDDVGLVRAYLDQLQPGGQVLVTVPAFNWLWSGHDVFLEHRRRYTRTSLEKVLTETGLEIVESRYFFALLLPLVIPLRLLDRLRLRAGAMEAKSSLKRHAAWVNSLLTWVLGVERCLLFPFNRLGGLSVFCLARKPSE